MMAKNVILISFTTRCTHSVCTVYDTCTHRCSLLPVVELLWSSPGIHFSFTLLLLCSDSTKFSGASGTSENQHNNMTLENHRHINLCSEKKKAKWYKCSIKSYWESGCVQAALLHGLPLFLLDFKMSTVSQKGTCQTQHCTNKAMVCMFILHFAFLTYWSEHDCFIH